MPSGGPTIAKAYVAVLPAMQGAQRSISKELIPELRGAGESGGEAMSSGIGDVLKSKSSWLAGIAKAALATAGIAAVKKFTSDVLSSYGEWEQLSGGVEQIFSSLDISSITKDAQAAYRTMGISASEYMDVMATTGATLKSTLGDAKGYATAQEGLAALADFSAGTGRSMDELREKFQLITRTSSSYLSIADQFAGVLPQSTDAFLDEAYAAGYLSKRYKKLSEVPLAEYQEAVTHKIRDGVKALGFMGQSAREATNTLEGSTKSMAASWSNLLVAFGTGNEEEINRAFQGFVDSAGVWLRNIAERLKIFIAGFIRSLPSMIGELLQEIGPSLGISTESLMENHLVRSIVGFGGRIQEAFQKVFGDVDFSSVLPVESFSTAFTQLSDGLDQTAERLASWLDGIDTETLESAFAGLKEAGESLEPVFNNLGDAADRVINEVISPALKELDTFIDESFIPGAEEFLKAAAEQYLPIIEDYLESASGWIDDISEDLSTVGGPLLKLLFQVLTDLFDWLWPVLTFLEEKLGWIADIAWKTFKAVTDNMMKNLENLANWIGEGLDYISTHYTQIRDTIAQGAQWLVDRVKALFWGGISAIVGFFGSLLAGAQNIFNGVLNAVLGFIINARNAFWNLISSIGSAFSNVYSLITSPFSQAFAYIRILWNNTIGKMRFTIPSWVPSLGGRSFSMPRLADGGLLTQSGTVMVGEAGPEILSLPKGAKVTPLSEADQASGTTFSVQVSNVDLTDDDQVKRLTREYLETLARIAMPAGLTLA